MSASGAESDGAVRELLRRTRSAGHERVADAYVIAEARRNLEIKAPPTVAAFEALLSDIDSAPPSTAAPPPGLDDGLPEKDRPVLAAAIRLACDTLVTGDRTHFGALYGETVGGVRIHRPRSLAETLGN